MLTDAPQSPAHQIARHLRRKEPAVGGHEGEMVAADGLHHFAHVVPQERLAARQGDQQRAKFR